MSCSSVRFVSTFFFFFLLPLYYLIQSNTALWTLLTADKQTMRQGAEGLHPDWFILAEPSDFFIVSGSEGNYW